MFSALDRKQVLIDGINNAKTGGRVVKGPWAGMPIRILSLEERATCPTSCAVWAACYGNGMPFASRYRYDGALMAALDRELRQHAIARRSRRGFVVRLHVLGDFPDLPYVQQWEAWMDEIPALHVWGYTAHAESSPIGSAIGEMNRIWPDRWAVRFSVAPSEEHSPMQSTVIWNKPIGRTVVDDTLSCPQELGSTDTCGSCGLCWSTEARDLRIAFMGHGRKTKGAHNSGGVSKLPVGFARARHPAGESRIL